MSKNKNIDDYFKEQLGSFNATPSPEVWANIEAQLKKKKKERRVIPLWWKVGGVAAVLALLLTVSGVFNNDEANLNNTIVQEDSNLKKEKLNNNQDIIDSSNKKKPVIEKKTIANENLKTNSNNQENATDIINNNTASDILNSIVENAITSSDKNQKKNIKDSKKTSFTKNTTTKETVALNDKDNSSEKDKFKNKLKDTNILNNNMPDKNDAVVVSENNKKFEKEVSKSNSFEDKNPINKLNIEDAIVKEEAKDKTEKELKEENKKSIFDAIDENKEAIAKNEKEKSNPYWEVTPNVGPVFYNSINGGSSIAASFADNPQSGDTNISYGVQVSYNVNDRLSVRTGISNVSLGYATGDVVLATSPTEVALKSVNYDNSGRTVLTAFDKGELENIPSDPNNPFSQVTQKSSGGSAEISQSLSYYEVPLELKYALVNKRFGINMIGGFSTLFLGNNEISVSDSSGFRSVLGEANNLNNLSFSTNIGVGFDYKISKRLKFNIEPIFKYQLNPYNTSVDFNPYYFGVYSGLSFKF